MYTIILLRMKNMASFNRYQFIFLNARIKGELGICFWDGGEKTGKSGLAIAVSELNARIKEHAEWKLVIYDDWVNDVKVDADLSNLLKLYSGKVPSSGIKDKVEGAFPMQLFYIQSEEKAYVPLEAGSSYHRIDSEREYGENFRMFRIGMESGNGRLRSFSEFKLCCILLSLAIGQIPYTFLEAGYLYELDIEIDQEKFGEYVSALKSRMERIQACCEEERENLKQRLWTVEPFPDVVFPEIDLEGERNGIQEKKKGRILKFREMFRCDDVTDILKYNRELLEAQMFYPRGLLHEENRKIQRMAKDMKGTDNFLNEIGKELLEKHICETINDICAQKDAQLKQQEFEEDIQRAERRIEEQAIRLMKKKERLQVLSFFCFLELFVTMPYVIRYCNEENNEMPLLWIPVALGTFALIYLGYHIYLWVLHRRSWGDYDKKVYGRLIRYKANKKEYLENILTSILKFQYFKRIEREQQQLFHDWNHGQEMLLCHKRMVENGNMGIEPLFHLLGEEKRRGYREEALNVDFMEEPKEEEYFRLPLYQDNQLEINYSGYMTKAAYPFIIRLILRKVIRKEARGDLNE